MAAHDYIIDNAPGAPVRTDINAALAAIVTQNSASIEPTALFPGMLWLDTGAGAQWPNGRLRQRNLTNTAWIDPQVPSAAAAYSEGTFTPRLDGSTVAGAGTYTSQQGVWTRVGRLVTFSASLAWSAHTGTGNMQVALVGLPTAMASPTPSHIVSVSATNLTFTGQLLAYVLPGSSNVILGTVATGVAVASVAMDAAASLTLTGSYATT